MNIEDSVEQHFKGASFLWSQRDVVVAAANYTLQDLAELDERVEARINALRIAGDQAWSTCKSGLDHEEPGTVFAASILAFESGDADKIDLVVEVSGQSQDAFRGTISALGWLEDEYFRSIIIDLVSAKSWQHRSLGIAACGVRRVNPRAYLNQAANSSNLFLKVRALKAAGQLKREDLLPVLQEHFQHTEPVCRFEAARSALLLGDRSALGTLGTFILSQSKYTLPAMQVALRVAEGQIALDWLKTQSRNPKRRREMLIGTGIVGNPAYIPILIKQMNLPELARAAGDAFTMITGIDLDEGKLEGARPEGFEAEADETPVEDRAGKDPDEGLSWPDVDLVSAWWEQNNESFPPRSRYLAGGLISPEHCSQLLRNGNQRNRQAAALELALGQEDVRYFNTKARGHWQIKRLQ